MQLKKIISNTGSLILLIVGMVTLGLLIVLGFDLFDARNKVQSIINRIKAFFGMEVTNNEGGKNYTPEDGKKAIEAVKSVYGVDMARRVEQIFRLETAHFKSGQYKKTGTPGLVVGSWPSPVPKSPTVKYTVNGKVYEYVIWTPKECALFLAAYIKKYNGDYARWNSTKESAKIAYRKKIESIKPKFV